MNIVHIGYGHWGANVARNITRTKDATLKAICDMNSAQLTIAKSVFGDTLKYKNSYKSFLGDPDVDAFTLAVQTEPSFEMAKDILNAGKHLFIEKPIATNAERALTLTNLAKEKHLILHCDHIMVYHPVIRYIKKMVDSGELGNITNIEVLRSNLGPVRKDVNAMMDLAVHDIAVVDYLTGGMEPVSIQATGQNMYGQQEALTFLTLIFDNFIAQIKSSWVSPIKERITMVCGTKKMVIFDDSRNMDKLSVYNCGLEKINGNDEFAFYDYKVRNGDIFVPYIPQEDALFNSIEHFVNCANTNTQSISGGEQSVKVMKILDTARQCMKKSHS